MKTTAVFGIVLLGLSPLVRAAEPWTLVTSDFESVSVTPTAIDANGITADVDGGKPRTFPLGDVVELNHDGVSTVSGLVLCVADGQRLVGKPKQIDGANLVWSTDKLGDVSVPLENILGILRDRTAVDALAETRSEDQAKLGTGDAIKGILTDAGGNAFVFTPATGDPVRVAPAAVASILFATPPNGRPVPVTPAFLVHVGGSVVAASGITLAGDSLSLTGVGPGATKVALADVRAIEHTGGTVAWLSSRVPTEATQTPYFGGSYPAKFDASVLGRPIQFGGRTYAHGIGVHSRSKLVYAVRPGDLTFRTRYAIDGALPLADVDVRVSVDGKPVHAVTGFKAGVLSPVVEASLAGAKTLTLEVDYGLGYDLQDRLNWIEPAVIRKAE